MSTFTLTTAGAFGVADLEAILAEHPELEVLDLRRAGTDTDAAIVDLLPRFSKLRALGIQGWDNWTGPDLGDQTLRALAKLPGLEQLHLNYCMVSMGTEPIFGEFSNLTRVWAEYWCTDEPAMLDDLKAQYPAITFLGFGTNHGDIEDDEPSLGG